MPVQIAYTVSIDVPLRNKILLELKVKRLKILKKIYFYFLFNFILKSVIFFILRLNDIRKHFFYCSFDSN
jgi:hypothetical protein